MAANRFLSNVNTQDIMRDMSVAAKCVKKPWAWTDDELAIAVNSLDCVCEYLNEVGGADLVVFALRMKRETLSGFQYARKFSSKGK